jgi:HEAT repeat protein
VTHCAKLALVLAAAIPAALAAGCGGASADQWMKEHLSPPSTADQLARIESEQPDQRREGLQAVAADAAARKVPAVVKLFCLVAKTDRDPMVRSAAVRGLAQMEGEDVLPALALVLAKDASPFVRCDAAVSLGRQARPGCVAPLAAALASDVNSGVRLAAAEALRNFKDKAAANALVGALDDPSLAAAMKAWESLRYMTGQNMPRKAQPWEDFLRLADDPFLAYGKPPPMPKGENQRPTFTKGPLDAIQGLFAKDPREAELQ